MKYRCLALLVAGLFLCFSGCSEKTISETVFMMDTVVTVTLYDTSDRAILSGCIDLMQELNDRLSRTNPDSEISRLNAAGGTPTDVSEDTARLIEKGLTYGALSDGAFDITIAPVSSLWDFHADEPSLPAPDALDAALKRVDYRNVAVEGNTVTLTGGAQLDLGGIAKGYIADCAAAFLRESGIERAVLNLGGNVVVLGSKRGADGWSVGIQAPFSPEETLSCAVTVADKTVVTSGIYQRSFVRDGVLYHHLLDTATGYPKESDLASATVICDASADADALSTICYLFGSEKALALADQEGFDLILIQRDGNVRTTDGIEERCGFRLLES